MSKNFSDEFLPKNNGYTYIPHELAARVNFGPTDHTTPISNELSLVGVSSNCMLLPGPHPLVPKSANVKGPILSIPPHTTLICSGDTEFGLLHSYNHTYNNIQFHSPLFLEQGTTVILDHASYEPKSTPPHVSGRGTVLAQHDMALSCNDLGTRFVTLPDAHLYLFVPRLLDHDQIASCSTLASDQIRVPGGFQGTLLDLCNALHPLPTSKSATVSFTATTAAADGAATGAADGEASPLPVIIPPLPYGTVWDIATFLSHNLFGAEGGPTTTTAGMSETVDPTVDADAVVHAETAKTQPEFRTAKLLSALGTHDSHLVVAASFQGAVTGIPFHITNIARSLESYLTTHNPLKLIGVCKIPGKHGGDLKYLPEEVLAVILSFVGDNGSVASSLSRHF